MAWKVNGNNGMQFRRKCVRIWLIRWVEDVSDCTCSKRLFYKILKSQQSATAKTLIFKYFLKIFHLYKKNIPTLGGVVT